MRNRQRGISLIELMTVVVIVAILGAIAVPSYRGYMLRANRTDAKTALMFYAGGLERCYTRYNNYHLDTNAAVGCPSVALPAASENGHYQITVTVPPDYATFTLTATPQGQQTKDTGCGNLTLDYRNTRGITGTKTVAECWGK